MPGEKELKEKSKSQYGKHTPVKENFFVKKFYEIFLKATPLKTYLNGAVTIGVIMYWWFTRIAWPLQVWIAYIVIVNISGLIYWSREKKRLEGELKRIEGELSGIQQEISERKEYFKDLKKKIDQENPDQPSKSK